jgi:hypothetical protein
LAEMAPQEVGKALKQTDVSSKALRLRKK